MAVWILAACLALAIVVGVVLGMALRRSRGTATETDALVAAARAAVRAAVEEETAAHTEEIRRTLARERADTISQLMRLSVEATRRSCGATRSATSRSCR